MTGEPHSRSEIGYQLRKGDRQLELASTLWVREFAGSPRQHHETASDNAHSEVVF